MLAIGGPGIAVIGRFRAVSLSRRRECRAVLPVPRPWGLRVEEGVVFVALVESTGVPLNAAEVRMQQVGRAMTNLLTTCGGTPKRRIPSANQQGATGPSGRAPG